MLVRVKAPHAVTSPTAADISRAVHAFDARGGGTTDAREARFDALYRQHYRRVLAYTLRRAPAETAVDVVAETFVVAWRRLELVPDQPLPWLLAVARKTLANDRRGARRRQSLLSELAAQHARPAGTVDDAFPASTILDALARLPAEDQELVKLVAWDDLPILDAAKVLGRSAAACRVRLHRARRRLADELARSAELRAAAQFQPLPKETNP